MEKFIGIHFLLQRPQRFCGCIDFAARIAPESVPRFEPTGAAVDQQRSRRKFSSLRAPAIQRDRSGADRKLRRKTEPSRILSDQNRTPLRTKGTPLLLWC